jgi:excisionase family DNA binding protein
MAPSARPLASAATGLYRTGSLPRLLTADETAELLRTTRKAVYALAERGQLSGVIRIGRRMLVQSDVLLDWLDQRHAPSPKESRR